MEAAPALSARPAGERAYWRVTPLCLAAALTILALAVRLIHLGSRSLWLDEAYSAWFSGQSWHYLWTVVPTYEPHPPFYYSLLKLWRMVAGDSPAGLRSLSVLFSAATVPVMMGAARELERQRPTGRPLLAVAAAGFLAAFGPMLLVLDQEARPYPLMILAYAVALLAQLRLFREFDQGGPGAWRSWLLLGGAAEIMLWSHGLGLLYAACLALALLPAWLAPPVSRERIARGGLTGVAVALAYLPCLTMILARTGDWGTGWLSWHPLMLVGLVDLYLLPTSALTVGTAVAAVTLFLLGLRAVISAMRTSAGDGERALLLLWFGPPLMAVLISQLFVPVFLPRALAATLVPAYVAIAAALARTSGRTERLVLGGALVATLVPIGLQIAARPAPEPWDQVRSFLATHAAPNDQVWLYPNDSALPLKATGMPEPRIHGIPGDYPATGFKGPIRAGSPAVVSLTPAQAQQFATDRALRTIPVIWLVTRQSYLFDPKGDLPAALARVRRAGPYTKWGYIGVQPFARR